MNLDGGEYQPRTRTATQECVCVRSSTPGYTPTGLTTGQVEKWADERRAIQGDPGITRDRRMKLLQALRDRANEAIEKLISESV